MAAGHRTPGLTGNSEPTTQHIGREAHGQHVAGPAHEVHRKDRPAAHRIDVRERVGGGDAPPVVRVVDDRREEVHRAEHRHAVAVQPDRRGVVAMLETHQEGVTGHADQPGDHLLEFAGRDLAGAAAAVRVAGETHARDVRRLVTALNAHPDQ